MSSSEELPAPGHARDRLQEPYFATAPDVVDKDGYTGFSVGRDFNREIVEPGTNETFPDGAVGIRVDDDFWTVGALPLKDYRTMPLPQIVSIFWPEVTDPIFKPDSSTFSQNKTA